MKRALLLALSLCLSVVSFAQLETAVPEDSPAKGGTGYMPVFQDSTLVFNIATTVTCYTNDYDPGYLGGCILTVPISFQRYDSIFGNTYNIFDFGAYDIYVREDTSNGMIFRFYPELDTEVVVCDMSLMPGDTFWMPEFHDKFPGVWPPDEYSYTEMFEKFTMVDSVSVVDGRKVIYLRPFNESLFFGSLYYPEFVPSLKFIEGIGPTYGPFGKIRFSMEPPLGLLLCVHYGDSLVYMNNPVLGCYQYGGGDVPEYPESVMRLYPNPASRMLNVEFEGVENPQGVFTISDIAGIVVLSQECNSTVTQLDVSRLKSGIYLVSFRNGKGYIVKKFVKI